MKHNLPDETHGSSVVIAFRATPQLVQALDELAAKDGLKRADIARTAAIRHVRKEGGWK
jgi:hypothetical protein